MIYNNFFALWQLLSPNLSILMCMTSAPNSTDTYFSRPLSISDWRGKCLESASSQLASYSYSYIQIF